VKQGNRGCLGLSTYPHVEAFFNQYEGQAALCIGETDPDFTVHQQPVVHVYDALLQAIGSSIDFLILFPFVPCQAVYSKKVAIFRLNDVFFGCVSKKVAELDKIGGVPYGCRNCCRICQ